jgi:hypothetical protein
LNLVFVVLRLQRPGYKSLRTGTWHYHHHATVAMGQLSYSKPPHLVFACFAAAWLQETAHTAL